MEGQDRPIGQVETQIEQMEKRLESQGAVIQQLEARLKGILRHVDVAEEEGKEPEMPLVPLADAIKALKKNVERHTNNLSEIIDRIEL